MGASDVTGGASDVTGGASDVTSEISNVPYKTVRFKNKAIIYFRLVNNATRSIAKGSSGVAGRANANVKRNPDPPYPVTLELTTRVAGREAKSATVVTKKSRGQGYGN